MIKAVIFDWGGVLIDDPAEELITYCAEALNIDKELFRAVWKKFDRKFQKGIISENMFWDNVCSELEVQKPNFSLWSSAFKNAYRPKKEIFALASQLRDNGYKVGFLSNTEIPAMKFFHEQQYDMFDVTVFSCAEGTRKPEKKIYEIILEKLGVKASEAVFIDNKPELIEGARKLGINTILFNNPDQVKKELADFSVKIA